MIGPDGRRVSRQLGSLEAALAWQRTAVDELAVTGLLDRGPTLAAAFESFIDGAEAGAVLAPKTGRPYKGSTTPGYRDAFAHVRGRPIAQMPVAQITTGDLKRLRDELIAERTWSGQTIRNVFTAVGAMFSHLLDREMIEVHPGRGLRLPAPSRGRQDAAVGMGDLAALIQALAETGDRTLVGLAGYGGLRLGELLGLAWEHVDLEHGRITIERAWDPKKRLYGFPKSEAGRRRVPIAPELRRLLVAHQLASGRRTGLVLGHDGERPASPEGMRTRIYRTWRTAGLERLRFHDGRHSAITAWVIGGTPLPVAQRAAGHSSITTTRRYVHVRDEDLDLAVEAMERTAERAHRGRSAT